MARSMVVDYEQAVRTGRKWEESVGDSGAIEDCMRALPALDGGGGENGEVMVKVEVEVEAEGEEMAMTEREAVRIWEAWGVSVSVSDSGGVVDIRDAC